MNKSKVIQLDSEPLIFDSGLILESMHESDCCEQHYLSMQDLTLDDFDGLEFDLTNDDFFERIEDYGIALKPIHGHPVRIPGYGYNNGYYSSELTLVLRSTESIDKFLKTYDISECQVIQD